VPIEQQESLANAKGNVRHRCVFEGSLRTKSKLTNRSNWHCIRCIHIRQLAPPSHMDAAVWVSECEYFEGGSKFDAQYGEFFDRRGGDKI